MQESTERHEGLTLENLKADNINPSPIECFYDALSRGDSIFANFTHLSDFVGEVGLLSDEESFALAATLQSNGVFCRRNQELLRLTMEYGETPDEFGVLPDREVYAQLIKQFLQSYPAIEWQEYVLAADDRREKAEVESCPDQALEFEAERRAYNLKRRRSDVPEDKLREYHFPKILDEGYEEYQTRIDRLTAEFLHEFYGQIAKAKIPKNPPNWREALKSPEIDVLLKKLEAKIRKTWRSETNWN